MKNLIQKIKNNKTLKKTQNKNFKLGFNKFKSELSENKRHLWIFVAGIIVTGAYDSLIPFFTGKIIDTIKNLSKVEIFGFEVYSFYILILVILLVRVTGTIVTVFYTQYFLANISNNVFKKYKKKYFEIISKYPVSFFKENQLGKITYLSNSGASSLSETVFKTSDLFSSVVFSISSLIFILFISYKVFFLILFFSLIYIGYFYLTVNERVKVTKEFNQVNKDISSFVTEKLNFLIEIKRFNKEGAESRNVNDKFNSDYENKFVNKRNFQIKNFSVISMLFHTMFTSVYFYVFYIYLNGGVTIGEVISLSMYAGWIVRNNNYILRTVSSYVDAFTIVGDSEEILQHQKENYSKGKTRIKNLQGEIEFKNVVFEYKQEESKEAENNEKSDNENKKTKRQKTEKEKNNFSLKKLNIKINKGEKVAFVGESGSGKTTSVDLIGAFLYPQKGEVLVDGVQTNKVNLNDLRKNIAYVSQDISIFNTTVKENIAYGSLRKKVSQKDIEESAKEASIDKFINNLKDGYETNVGEKGLKLSGGQKQRISIARAFLKNPKILILDEPTSALDIESEKKVTKSLESLMKDKTTIIIAHRLSTIKNVDRIFVFKDGEVVESGSYKELVEKKGEFYKMVEMHLEFSQI